MHLKIKLGNYARLGQVLQSAIDVKKKKKKIIFVSTTHIKLKVL